MIRPLALLVALFVATTAQAGACRDDRIDIRGPWGDAQFSIEIADEPAEQQRGLMFREHIPASQGMLFVYPQPGEPAFWMKNTLVPLDMLFITARGQVQHVHAEAIPGDLTPISGGPGILAVLEIRGGLAEAIGIGPGDTVRHPAFGADADWPCEPPAQ